MAKLTQFGLGGEEWSNSTRFGLDGYKEKG